MNNNQMFLNDGTAQTNSNRPLLMTVHEAAKALRISERKLWSLTQQDKLACVRIGRRVLYDPRDMRQWIDSLKGGNV